MTTPCQHTVTTAKSGGSTRFTHIESQFTDYDSRPTMKTHKDLEVWQTAIDLAKEVYETTKTYPREEMFGLVSQMRRCAVSIPSNIAEGAARNGTKEFLQFLHIALGSLSELDTQIEISRETGIGDRSQLEHLQEMTTRVKMMTNGLVRSLKRDNSPPTSLD
jgi:four helix bundle protein